MPDGQIKKSRGYRIKHLRFLSKANLMLLKVGKGYKISGGGRILMYLKIITGSWAKMIKNSKRNKGQLEEIETFRNQERKYGIKIKPLNFEKGIQPDEIEYGFVKLGGKNEN